MNLCHLQLCQGCWSAAPQAKANGKWSPLLGKACRILGLKYRCLHAAKIKKWVWLLIFYYIDTHWQCFPGLLFPTEMCPEVPTIWEQVLQAVEARATSLKEEKSIPPPPLASCLNCSVLPESTKFPVSCSSSQKKKTFWKGLKFYTNTSPYAET